MATNKLANRSNKQTKKVIAGKFSSTKVILGAIVTEKSSFVGNSGNTIVFRVHDDASKIDIKGAVEEIFGKKVQSVRTARILGKPKQRAKVSGRSNNFKKAYVTLVAGEKIEITEL